MVQKKTESEGKVTESPIEIFYMSLSEYGVEEIDVSPLSVELPVVFTRHFKVITNFYVFTPRNIKTLPLESISGFLQTLV